MNLTEYFDEFLEFLLNIRGYSTQTVKSYEFVLNDFTNYFELEDAQDGYVLNITAYRIKIANLSKKSISMYLSAIKSFVKYLNDYQNIKIKLKGAQRVKVPKSLPKPLQQDDILEVLNSQDEQTRVIIKVFYGLGLRISEVANIKLSDFKGEFLQVFGKGSKTREVPIMPSLTQEIQAYIQHYKPKKYLFEKGGVSLKNTQIRYIINKTFKSHGIKATPHQLRHSFASHLLNEGARIADVSELLGHSSMASTQIYTKLTSQTKLQNYLKAHPLAKD